MNTRANVNVRTNTYINPRRPVVRVSLQLRTTNPDPCSAPPILPSTLTISTPPIVTTTDASTKCLQPPLIARCNRESKLRMWQGPPGRAQNHQIRVQKEGRGLKPPAQGQRISTNPGHTNSRLEKPCGFVSKRTESGAGGRSFLHGQQWIRREREQRANTGE